MLSEPLIVTVPNMVVACCGTPNREVPVSTIAWHLGWWAPVLRRTSGTTPGKQLFFVQVPVHGPQKYLYGLFCKQNIMVGTEDASAGLCTPKQIARKHSISLHS